MENISLINCQEQIRNSGYSLYFVHTFLIESVQVLFVKSLLKIR